jgi:hypothetical protein
MSTHKIEFKVTVTADEMDGSPQESAEILLGILEEDLNKFLADEFEIEVLDCEEVSKENK